MHWTEIFDRAAGNVVVLEVRGHMSLGEDEATLFRRAASLAESGEIRVVLNLRHVPYIDSVGIGEIIRTYMRLTRAGGSLKLCEAAPRVAEVLEATNLDTVLEVFATEDEALRSFTGAER